VKARDVIGRRIVEVRQFRYFNTKYGKTESNVTSFLLDNGTVLVPGVAETGDDYAIDFQVVKQRAKP
jgi:hypothetical protein